MATDRSPDRIDGLVPQPGRGHARHFSWAALAGVIAAILGLATFHQSTSDANPHAVCPAILPAFAKLKGLRIAPGWNRKVRELLGGVRGCTHLVEMLGPLATVAYQSIGVSKIPQPDGGTLAAPADPTRKPKRIDSCHALAADGEVVRKRWPAFYRGAKTSE